MFTSDIATSIEEYRIKYPNNKSAVLMIASSDIGDVVCGYFDGNYDRHTIANYITSFVYVNEWKVSLQSASIY